MQAKVEKLFVKHKTDDAMSGVKSIVIKNFKIVGQKETQPFRTCLLVSREQASLFGCKAGDFRENIFSSGFDLQSLCSGDEIRIGDIFARVTFDCEPCDKISHVASVSKLKGKRGVLIDFINDGEIKIGDIFEKTKSQKFEHVPSEYYERIDWYLKNKLQGDIYAMDLLWNTGVSKGLVRVLPQIMKKHSMKNIEKVIFKKNIK